MICQKKLQAHFVLKFLNSVKIKQREQGSIICYDFHACEFFLRSCHQPLRRTWCSLESQGEADLCPNLKWKFISRKLMFNKANTESTVNSSKCFYKKFGSKLSSSYRILDRAYFYSPQLLINRFNLNHTQYPLRYYCQKTINQEINSRRWIFVVILSGLSVGIAIYISKIFYSYHSLDAPIETSPTKEPPIPLRFPELPEQIPDEISYLIIGGGTAAFAAFRAIKSSDPTAKVLVINNELHYPYMRPPLSKELIFSKSKDAEEKFSFIQWNGKQRSVFFEPDEFYTNIEELILSETGGISVARGWNVKRLDHDNKIAVLDDGKTIKYDKCLLATGSIPKKLAVLSKDNPDILKKVLYYRSLDEFSQLDDVIKDNSKSVIVIGSSFSGTELACSLARKGVRVIQMFKEENVLADVLPEYLAKSLTLKIQQQGVNIIKGSEIQKVKLVNDKVCLTTSNGNEVTADHVIVALGVMPNTDLAETAGLEVDKTLGGFVVNAEFLARRDLYAAGDCASFYDVKYGRRRVEHHDHAVISGRLAGENMTGKGKIFKIQSMFWSDIAPELGFEAVGLVDSALPTVAIYMQRHEKEIEPQASATTKQPLNLDNVKGVIFYLKNNMVVGIVLWNLFNRIPIARQVLNSDVAYDDLYEISKHFDFL